MAAEDHEESDVRVVQRGGAGLVFCRPLFSSDSRVLLIASGDVVKVLNITSGRTVRILQGHTSKVTSIALNRHNKFQIYSTSCDRSIIKWDFVDGSRLKCYKCPSVLKAVIPTGTKNILIGIREGKSKGEHDVVRVVLPCAADEAVAFERIHKRVAAHQRALALGCNDDFVASIYEETLTVSWLNKEKPALRKIKAKRHMTCVACHPTERCIATGSSIGEIMLWFLKDQTHVSTKYHWHSLPLADLCFTALGSHMMSGGRECVLVKWRYNTPMNDTMPRLGAPIVSITCSHDNLYYATCHSDNSIQVISSQFKIIQQYVGLCQGNLDEMVKNLVPTGLIVDPRTSALVLNGLPGHLQFYSMRSDSQLYSLDIVCQNYISPDELKNPLVLTELERAAFSDSGDWLVTVERRDDGLTSVEQRQKFWAFDYQNQKFSLNTIVDLSSQGPIVSVKFRPSNRETDYPPTVVTACKDGKFSLWQLVDDTDIYRERSCWACESVGFYRSMPIEVADFSSDGSVLGVAFDHTLTLWEPDTNALKKILPQKSKIRYIMFGCGKYTHLVTLVTEKHLLVLNLLTCSVMWVSGMKVVTATQDKLTGVIAVFTRDRKLTVFKPSQSEPIYSLTSLTSNQILSAVFVPHQRSSQTETGILSWQQKSQLYFLTNKHELLTLTSEEEETTPEAASSMLPELLQSTPFSILLSEQRKQAVPGGPADRQHDQLGLPGATYLKEMLGTPAHVLPPVRSLCMSFMDSLMVSTKKSKKGEEEEDEEEDEKEDSEGAESESEMEVDEPIEKTKDTAPVQTQTTLLGQKLNDSTERDIDSIALHTLNWISTS